MAQAECAGEAARQARAREQQEAAEEGARQARIREQAAETERAPVNPFPFLSPLLGPVESRPTPPVQIPPGG